MWRLKYLKRERIVGGVILVEKEKRIFGILAELSQNAWLSRFLDAIESRGGRIINISMSKEGPERVVFVAVECEYCSADDIVRSVEAVDGVLNVRVIYPVAGGRLLYDPTTSHFEFGTTGCRTVLFGRASVGALINGLFTKFGSSAGSLLYNIGLDIGRRVYEAYVERFGVTSVDIALEILKALLVSAGWVSDLEVVSRSFSSVTFSVYNSFECFMRRGSREKSSNLVRGVLAGYTAKLYRAQRVESVERRCIALGDKYCEIIVSF